MIRSADAARSKRPGRWALIACWACLQASVCSANDERAAPEPELVQMPASIPGKRDDFAVFWHRFTDALDRGDVAILGSQTRWPFLFAGKELELNDFSTLWRGLFSSSIRRCLRRATPLLEADGSRSAFCEGTIFVFRIDAGAWRFAEIGADD